MDLRDLNIDLDLIQPYLDAHPWPRLFLTMSGGHLYGFASEDSDYDLRGCHIAAAEACLRLRPPRDTYDILDRDCRIEMDIVTHDAAKYFRMLLGKNGYVLEQIFSPLIVEATEDFDELKSIASRCITKHHRHHFRSFASKQWDKVSNAAHGTVKGLLYTYRPLLAGIHLMRTGEVESNLRVLNEHFELPWIDDLIQAKVEGSERALLSDADLDFHNQQFNRLSMILDKASEESTLPDEPSASAELDDFLIRMRLGA
ncbi:MAG: DNA polymerase beta superfamily protein [Phycisphaerales bacterium JB050]